VRYVDASVVLEMLFPAGREVLPRDEEGRVVSSELVEVEGFRAIDRARLAGDLDDADAARKRKELTDTLTLLDLAPIDRRVIALASSSFGVNVRALDALHVATAQLLAHEAADEPFEFWTHDDRQATAALARGLTVRGA